MNHERELENPISQPYSNTGTIGVRLPDLNPGWRTNSIFVFPFVHLPRCRHLRIVPKFPSERLQKRSMPREITEYQVPEGRIGEIKKKPSDESAIQGGVRTYVSSSSALLMILGMRYIQSWALSRFLAKKC
jgi:hypothetical protein